VNKINIDHSVVSNTGYSLDDFVWRVLVWACEATFIMMAAENFDEGVVETALGQVFGEEGGEHIHDNLADTMDFPTPGLSDELADEVFERHRLVHWGRRDSEDGEEVVEA